MLDKADRIRWLKRISGLLMDRKAKIERLCPRFGYLHCYHGGVQPGGTASPVAESFIEKVDAVLNYDKQGFDALLNQLRRLDLRDRAEELERAQIKFHSTIRERASIIERPVNCGGGEGGGRLCVDDLLTGLARQLGDAVTEVAASVAAEQKANEPPAGIEDRMIEGLSGRDAYGKTPRDHLVDAIDELLKNPVHRDRALEKVAKLRNDHPDLMRWALDRWLHPNMTKHKLSFEGPSWTPPKEVLMLFYYALLVAVRDFSVESQEKRWYFHDSVDQDGKPVANDFNEAACLAAERADTDAAFRDYVWDTLNNKVRGDLQHPAGQESPQSLAPEQIRQIVEQTLTAKQAGERALAVDLKKILQPPSEAEKRAYDSYLWVCKNHPETVTALKHGQYASDRMYAAAIEESPCYNDKEGHPLRHPSFDSWQRYIRSYKSKISDHNGSSQQVAAQPHNVASQDNIQDRAEVTNRWKPH